MLRQDEERRARWVTIACLAGLALASAACGTGGDDDSIGGDGDGDTDADGDGTFTGRIVGEGAGDAHPALAGVEVELLDASGAVLDGTQTDGSGHYGLTADPASMAFVAAGPTDGYVGQLRAEGIRDGAEFYDITLQAESAIEDVHEAVGLTYDPTRGTVVLGFNPVDHQAGGEGGALDPASDDPPFILVDDTAVSGTRLPPVCPSTGADPCVDGERGDFVFFPNVAPGPHQVTLVQPTGGTCALRFAVDSWLVRAHTSTIIEVDCVAN